jgi:hypothetical protein
MEASALAAPQLHQICCNTGLSGPFSAVQDTMCMGLASVCCCPAGQTSLTKDFSTQVGSWQAGPTAEAQQSIHANPQKLNNRLVQ